MPKTWSVSPAVLITALTAFPGGGLAGAVFSWLVNRREPTVVTYLINRTELADPRASALIPNLSIHAGKESIQELYAHTIDIDIPQGSEVESAQVGVFFPHKVRIYGTSTETPSQLYNINCGPVDNGVKCKISPLYRSSNKKTYRIVLATDEKVSPSVEVVAKDIHVISAQDFVASKSSFWDSFASSKGVGITAAVITLISLLVAQFTLVRRIFRRGSSLSGGMLVGKVLDEQGRAVSDADVEVVLESPSHNFPPTKTDRLGDFLLGGLRKFSLYSGRARITHPDFLPVDILIDSPIVSVKLQRKDQAQRPDRTSG